MSGGERVGLNERDERVRDTGMEEGWKILEARGVESLETGGESVGR